MKSSVKKVIVTVAVLAAIAVVVFLMTRRKVEDFHEKYEGVDLSVAVDGMERGGTYTEYLTTHKDAKDATEGVEVDLYNYASTGDVEVYNDYEGVEKALYTGVDSKVTWKVNVPETGFYNIYIEYL
jgi:hypothetical protein